MNPFQLPGALQDLFDLYPHRMVVLSVGVMLLVSGVCASLGRRFRIPTIVFLLLVGILLGPHFIGLVQPSHLGRGSRVIISIAIALILFEGAMMIELGELRRRARALVGIVIVAPPLMLGISGVAVHAILGVSWEASWLAAALLTVSGPTVVFPLLKEVPLDRHLRALLEAESVIVAAVGVLLTNTVFEFVAVPGTTLLAGLVSLGSDLLVGGVVGAATFVVVRQASKVLGSPGEAAERLLILGAVVVSYAIAEILVPRAGIVTVTVFGALIGTSDPLRRAGRQFQSDIITIATSLVFVLLGAQLDLRLLGSIGAGAIGIAILLMAVIRPGAIFIGTTLSGLPWRDRAFIAWLGPRGLVTASMAALTEIQARQAGVVGAEMLDELVLVAVLLTVLVQGGGAVWVANKLKVLRRSPDLTGLVPAMSAVDIAPLDVASLEDASELATGSRKGP